MFAVDNIDETLGRLRKRGAQLLGEVVQYQDSYRLCYIRGALRTSHRPRPGTLLSEMDHNYPNAGSDRCSEAGLQAICSGDEKRVSQDY
jgi:hypothetical protein